MRGLPQMSEVPVPHPPRNLEPDQEGRPDSDQKRKHVMNWIPGWNSPADADWWSNFYFWLGIAFLILLAVSEVASHFYGLRKDALLDASHRADAVRRHHEQQKETERHKAEVEILHQKAVDAEKALAEIRARNTLRELTPRQQREITAALAPFWGQPVSVISLMSDAESAHFAKSFASALTAAGWRLNVGQGIHNEDPVGVIVSVNRKDADEGSLPAAFEPLLGALLRCEVISERSVRADLSLRPGQLGIIIGRKPPPAA